MDPNINHTECCRMDMLMDEPFMVLGLDLKVSVSGPSLDAEAGYTLKDFKIQL